MNSGDLLEFRAVLSMTAATLGRDLDEPTFEGYWDALQDLSIEDFALACTRARRERKFFPFPVELRALSGEIKPECRAIHAWHACARSAASCGAWESVCFDDPLINATVRNIGGWRQLCQKSGDDFSVWARKEFERVYVQLCASGATVESCAHLVGQHELNNVPLGFEIPAPKMITTGLPPHDVKLLNASAPLKMITEGEA